MRFVIGFLFLLPLSGMAGEVPEMNHSLKPQTLSNKILQIIQGGDSPRPQADEALGEEKSRSPLGVYLDIEFRGAFAPSDAISAEREIRDFGLVEVYEDAVDGKIDQMEKLLLERCAGEETPLSSEILHALKRKGKHAKKLRIKQKASPGNSAWARRLALVAFMIRENTELRGRRLPAAKKEDLDQLVLRAFESEFGENFADPLDKKNGGLRIHLEEKGAEGQALLEKYENLVATFEKGLESRKAEGSPMGVSDAEPVIEELGELFSSSMELGCAGSEMEGPALNMLTRIIGKLSWTTANRGAVLDYILGEAPGVPPMDFEKYHAPFHHSATFRLHTMGQKSALDTIRRSLQGGELRELSEQIKLRSRFTD